MPTCHPIHVRFEQDLIVTNQHGNQFHFAAGSLLHGKLSLVPNDGPLGVREFPNPQFIASSFEFQHEGKRCTYSGLLTPGDLWPSSGTTVQSHISAFTPHIGPVDGMLDGREDWSCILPDGRTHTLRLKYIGCSFELMLTDGGILLRCWHYDPAAGTDVTIFYPKRFTELLFQKATRLYLDSDGMVEDFIPHGESYVSIDQ